MEADSIYGFLMVDGHDIDFGKEAVRALLEMACSILYFVVHASAAIELWHESVSEESEGAEDGKEH